MARRFAGAAILGFVTAIGIAGFAAPASDPTSECVEPQWSIGEKVCASVDGWDVYVDGDILWTHGPDPAAPQGSSPIVGDDQCLDSGAGDQIAYLYHCEPVPPVCVDETSAQRRLVAIYARPQDVADRYNETAPLIRDSIETMNGIIHHEAGLFNVTADVYALCQEGTLVVHDEPLTTTSDEDAVLGELASRGYNRSNEKYVVYYDDFVPGLAGYAVGLHRNDTAGSSNPHNGVAYAVMTKSLDPVVFAHEYGHAMGAVQKSAPHNIGAHCWDGQDIVCYDDRSLGYSGPVSGLVPHYAKRYIPVICADLTHFDCGHDDYFHPDPPQGSYLDTHWNIGSPNNLYIRFA